MLAILYTGGQDAKDEPKLLGTVENKLGMADWLKSEGHEFIVSETLLMWMQPVDSSTRTTGDG